MPGVEVGLGALADVALPLGEPQEEGCGLGQAGAGSGDPTGAEGLGGGRGSQLAQDMPGGEPLKQPTVFGAGDGREPSGQPALEQHEVAVNLWEHAAGHEQIPDVRDRASRGQLAQPVVSEGDFTVREGSQDLLDVRLSHPGECISGTWRLPDLIEQRDELGADATGAVVQKFLQALGQDAVSAGPELVVQGLAAAAFAVEVAEAARALGAEPAAVRGDAGGQALDLAVGATAVGLQRPGPARRAEIPLGPVRRPDAHGSAAVREVPKIFRT
jgi:hypothetical protein